jgi:hypothetical protein
MKYGVEMGLGVMIYMLSFIKICSSIEKLIGGIHRQHGDHINLLLFFLNKESRLKRDRLGELGIKERIILKYVNEAELESKTRHSE